MAIQSVCAKQVVVANRDTTAAQAAKLMRDEHVGDIVVVEGEGAGAQPVGLVTDRDIVLAVVATKLDPEVFTLGDLVFEPLITCPEDYGVFEAIQLMRAHGIRRLPVVGDQGELRGIVTIDDLIQLIAEELSELGKVISREQAREVRSRR